MAESAVRVVVGNTQLAMIDVISGMLLLRQEHRWFGEKMDALTIGGYHVAEGEGGVAMVAFPKDVEAVVYGAVAAGLVVGVVEVVGYGVGKQCVENGPRQLGFEN